MYSPQFYKEKNMDAICALIHEAPFAVLLTTGGQQISHLPFVLETFEDQEPVLIGHMARANPHWQELLSAGQCRVLFQGPNGYITPAWYEPQDDNVPTWNYVVVHVSGKFEVIEDKQEAFETMNKLVEVFELSYESDWKLPRGEKAIDNLMNGIVVFKIVNLEFAAKFKLSQKQSKADRKNVITQLRANGDQTLARLADKMAAAADNC